MYRYHYHKTAQQVLLIEKEYLENQMSGLTKEQAKHILAGMVLHMEARGYNITNIMRTELVGPNYNWHKNII